MASPEATREPEALAGSARSPRHVAVIMDGNGRWATARGLGRTEGHRKGVETVRRIVRHAGDIGVEYLTLFSFSSENWRRPPEEVSFLMGLLRYFIRRDLVDLHANNVRIRVAGERDGLLPDIRALLEEAEAVTRDNTGLTLVIAFNYGSRQEILRAVRALAELVAAGTVAPSSIDEALFERHLYTAGMPDPDLVIRTSGEMRISNFLLWQSAYAEYVFPAVCWPDFDEAEFDRAVEEFRARDRRFGGLPAPAASVR